MAARSPTRVAPSSSQAAFADAMIVLTCRSSVCQLKRNGQSAQTIAQCSKTAVVCVESCTGDAGTCRRIRCANVKWVYAKAELKSIANFVLAAAVARVAWIWNSHRDLLFALSPYARSDRIPGRILHLQFRRKFRVARVVSKVVEAEDFTNSGTRFVCSGVLHLWRALYGAGYLGGTPDRPCARTVSLDPRIGWGRRSGFHSDSVECTLFRVQAISHG